MKCKYKTGPAFLKECDNFSSCFCGFKGAPVLTPTVVKFDNNVDRISRSVFRIVGAHKHVPFK